MSASAAIINPSSPLPVQGAAADGVLASGNPVQIGGKYEASNPTYSDGQIGYLRIGSDGRLLVNGLPGSLGQQTMANSTPVVIASDQSAFPVKLDDGSGNPIGKGQATMANSLPMVLPSDQSAIPTKLQDGSGSAVTKGQSTMAGSLPVVLPSDQVVSTTDASNGSVSGGSAGTKSAMIGAIYNTALPTLSNGQQAAFQLDSNARLIIAPLTNTSKVKAQLQDDSGNSITVGQKVAASSVPVVIASDQGSVPSKPDAYVNGSPASGTATTTASTITAPGNAIGFILSSDDSNVDTIRYRIGGTASTSTGVQLQPGRDSGFIPCGANISVCAQSSSATYQIQWIQR